jgi:hypothetical protein
MTGWSLPSISPEAMRNSKAYPIWPAAPVTATRTGFLLMTISEEKLKQNVTNMLASTSRHMSYRRYDNFSVPRFA